MTNQRWPQIEKLLRQHLGSGTFIYLMYASPSRVKIGRTLHIEKRRLTLERDLGKSVVLMGYCTASPRLELGLHHVFTDTRLDGEWFSHEPLLDRLARTFNALPPTTPNSPLWTPEISDKKLVEQLMTFPHVQ